MTRPRDSFLLVPWGENFLERLLDRALEDTGGDVGGAVFLFPNSRPEKYLSRLLRRDPRVRRPLIMPRMLTVTALFAELRGRILARPVWSAGLLDRVGLLLSCIRAESALSGSGEPFFALDDAGRFFPWGLRLAGLLEECLNQHRKPENFPHAEGTVSAFAATLLARLGQIYSRYAAGLEEREWTTPGLDASLVADHLRAHGSLPGGGVGGDPLYIAGFHALNGTENILFRHLWEQGARVVIHADPALAAAAGTQPDKADAHWSCRIFSEWAEEWRADLELLGSGETRPGPRVRFYQGFDLHSQLTVLEKELEDLAEERPTRPEQNPCSGEQPEDAEERGEEARDEAADTVVVLPDSGLLMPVLHHLPRTDINISMGYPLSRSPLFRLLDTLARLQEGRRGKGYYWRDLVDLIRHPYLKMLRPEASGTEPPGGDDSFPLRKELHRLEQALRGNGRAYPAPLVQLEGMYLLLGPEETPPRTVLALLDKLFAVCLGNFENLATPRELGAALEKLCDLLLTHGAHLWERFLIDSECLFRIMQSLIPELSRSALAQERFSAQTLYGILRRLMQAERVPFEASPLVGLQVMGMLETRLLSFRRVVIMDTGEHSLPGSPAGDPLLPEALRPELGLPSLASREQVSAYHFFRLLAGAEEAALLWEEGGDAPGIQAQKKKKSRFVEELLWREEKKIGRLLSGKGQDGPLSVIGASVSPIPGQASGIVLTESMRALLLESLSGPVSASLLDGYLRCPVQFFFQRLARLAPADEVIEGDDPLAVGDLFHQALQEGYRPYLGKDLPGGEELFALLGRELENGFFSLPGYAALASGLPADSALMLRVAAKKRLEYYLLRQPPARPLALEARLSSPFTVSGRRLMLYGKADRIDVRQVPGEEGNSVPGIVILDYKTGRIPQVNTGVWGDDGLWGRLESWRPDTAALDADGADPLLREVADRIQSVQLPLYLLLYSLGGGAFPDDRRLPAMAVHDAAWVELAAQGEEKFIFPEKYSAEQRAEMVEKRCALLVNFLLRHMLESSRVCPRPGRHCLWCSSDKLCILDSK